MKKQLLNVVTTSFLRKSFCQISALTILTLFSFHTAYAQKWNILGNEGQVSSLAATYPSIAVVDDVPYVVYKDAVNSKVKKRNITTGDWEQFGDIIGTRLGFTKLFTDRSNNLYVTYVDTVAGSKLGVEMYNLATNTWEPLGNVSSNLYVSTGSVNNNISQYSSSPRCSMAFDSDNNPYIAFSDGSNLTPYVKKFDGTAWVTVGTGAVDAAAGAVSPSLVFDEADVPWLTFVKVTVVASPYSVSSTGTMALYKCVSGLWSSITPGVTAAIRHTNMVLNSANNLTIAYFNTANTNRAAVIVYNKTAGTWGTVTTLSLRDAPDLRLIKDISGNLYCSFNDYYAASPNRFVARVFKQAYNATAWKELKDPLSSLGVDSAIGNPNIAIGNDSVKVYIVYTKNNSSTPAVSTPIVRAYEPAPPPATLTTNAASSITTTSAVAGGNVTSDGGTTVTERGFVYSTSANPTTANTKVVATTGGMGTFTANITGLSPATFYNIRAYAINGGSTPTITYGNNVRLNTLVIPDVVVTTPKQMEFLNRGLVAVRSATSKVFVSWRMFGTDPTSISFNVYRDNVLLNNTPITNSTNYEDNTTSNGTYTVKPILNGVEGAASEVATVWANNQLTIPIQIPPGSTTPDGTAYTYTANDCSVGDVDGDGAYEIFLKWEPTAKNDNAGGYSGNTIIDCYKLNGTRLWRIDLGRNINAGPHFTQFMVYDLDGDGKAEMACKTADGTVDGTGITIGDPLVDYRTSAGWVQSGPEYLTVFNGLTGAAMSTVNYQPARGNISDWGDTYGNRADRFVSAVAYLDGARPSLIIGRGYYDKLVRAAYDFRNGQLTLRWIFNSKEAGNEAYSSMGNHQMTIGDVDGDGKDEVFNGSSAINDNGERLWTSGNGHGDALHMSDMDPDRPGQEMWQCLESESQYTPYGIRLNDARTGQNIFAAPTTGDVGRALAADIDPNHRGYEMWSSSGNLYNVQDGQIGTERPTGGSQSVNFAIWWDGDLGRELLDGTILDKWNPTTKSLNRLFTIYNAAPVSSNNDTKKNPCLMGDLLGDWREEIILRKSDNTALILFTTTIPTENRIYTLMHDPQYRVAIAWQNSAYNQPPHPSFFLGYDMAAPPVPNIYLAGKATVLPVKLLSFNAIPKDKQVLVDWSATNEINTKNYVVERSADGKNFIAIETLDDKGNTGNINRYSTVDNQPLDGVSYYRLKQVDNDGKFVYSETKTVRFSRTKQLLLYPNPTVSYVKMELPGSSDNLTITLSSIDGKLLFRGQGSLSQINSSVNNLLPTLAPGYYPIQVADKDVVFKAQLIKR